MTAKLDPAPLAFDASGTPFSPIYHDIYHSADSGPGQARHIFLAGNDLPSRWAQAHSFTIVESGFGSGLNFLATWQAWRADPQRCGRLYFVSIEKHPFQRDALAALHARYPEFAPLAAQLQSAWPLLVPGLQRRQFDDGRVILTLAFGDITAVANSLRVGADAFYLDGFSPERNSRMWSPQTMKALARLAKRDTTFATYTTARAVREALADAGFAVEKRAGYGRKREMLAGHYAPRGSRRQAPAPAPQWPERRAIVIGAGLAGAAATERLAARGWHVEIIERRSCPAAEASGMPAGIFHPHLSPDDCLLSRFTRAGFLHALDRWQALQAAGRAFTWRRCGALQLAGGGEEMKMAETLRALGYPPDYAQYLPREKAGQLAGHRLSSGGWWFPAGGWLRPAELIAAQLAAMENLTVHFNSAAHALVRDVAGWRVLARDGSVIAAAPVVVLAGAHDAARLTVVGAPLQRIRGQITLLQAPALSQLSTVLCGGGYLLPTGNGTAIAGASYDPGVEDPLPQPAQHALNLERVARLLPDAVLPPSAVYGGDVGFRCAAPDHMPLIGALPDIDAAHAQAGELGGAQPAELPRLTGLYGAFGYASRGLTWAALGGELLASIIEGEALPVETTLADAVDPGRFVLKQLRRGKLAPSDL
ncbi:MAG TPA: bifunctional tRNA (5-methylaminomethyl-2-thiouridine)(34)-methyltransferase MnmD/FAD-dependent 5-carboxymethylaminomethyl-2-thiouridine(34) oxidoreductase MnmC [Burkholderiales bacterium]|nr:bifunctional tRNA (5-methylaminomethyl-2-thiouridine)(34)-methyltransferase MnmD/FAD-dependent 5-carboxymethylaminomethyl-2-thiouridine(34) oxidoreductase MnmC [Burkholderiales bacterium]